ncbi:hypothetical protein GA0070216_114147 [Micromonospora matsumotoense]|uniref:Uncharacterized protein n=1 Tax=Micromonospora matsumotoense TaxID=121616 RepID=A0A1C5A8B9_9ACTN|nr:hypothetical protein [Micromonospora matsumotoense]SCF41468.1 hypothetical protein GA0070216_114147 [Micromonospora matsumotoense]
MARQTAALSHPHWDRRPADPIRYRITARIADWWNGRQDARAGLPAVAPDPDPTEPPHGRSAAFTPHLEKLRRMANDAMHHELVHLQQEVAEPAYQLARAGAQLVEAERALTRAQEALRDLKAPTEDELRARRVGETDTDESVVRKRRLAPYLERRARLEAHRQEAEEALVRLRQTRAELQERIARSQSVAAARARRIHEHSWRRIGSYWQRLVRKHPAGEQLNRTLRPGGPEVPGWIDPAGERVTAGTAAGARPEPT